MTLLGWKDIRHLQNIDASSSLVSTDTKMNQNNVKNEHNNGGKWTVIFEVRTFPKPQWITMH